MKCDCECDISIETAHFNLLKHQSIDLVHVNCFFFFCAFYWLNTNGNFSLVIYQLPPFPNENRFIPIFLRKSSYFHLSTLTIWSRQWLTDYSEKHPITSNLFYSYSPSSASGPLGNGKRQTKRKKSSHIHNVRAHHKQKDISNKITVNDSLCA